jgi:uncharacterized repeat protein (TIGR03803 family)
MLPFMRLRTLCLAGLTNFATLTSNAAPGFDPVITFKVGPAASPTQLLLHSDGKFYGASGTGGDNGHGALFQLTPSGDLKWLSFTGTGGDLPGKTPDGAMIARDGWLWGTTTVGGAINSNGLIYRLRPETGEYQVITSVTGSGEMAGNNVTGGLTSDGNGALWGVTRTGGSAGYGVIFKVDERTGQYLPTSLPTGFSNPKEPISIDYHGGFLWAIMTGNIGNGSVWRVDPGNLATKVQVGEFTGATTTLGKARGFNAAAGLVSDGLGYLWGVTSGGGSSGNGTAFKIDTAAAPAIANTTTIIDFSGNAGTFKGSSPRGKLVLGSDGKLWGVSNTGGASGRGTVFKIDPQDGTFTTVVEFGSAGLSSLNLSAPLNGLTFDGEDHFWGICASGTNGENWAFYRVAIADGSVTKVADFTATGPAPDGRSPKTAPVGKANSDWLYGTTTGGGLYGFGTLYRYNAVTGEHETLVNFSGQTGLTAGSDPSARLHIHTDGTVWGTTRVGGADQLGSVFKYNPATRRFTHVGSFNGSNGPVIGSAPVGRLTTGPDGFIWGTASNSAPTGGDGCLFKVDPNGGGIVVVKLFQGDWVTNPPGGKRLESGLVVDQQGFIWGATTRGGGISATPATTVGYGTIFRVNPISHEVTTVFRFTGDAGALPGMEPKGELVLDGDGMIWGQTSTRVFAFNPATQTMLMNEPFATAVGYPLDLAIGGGLYLHRDGFYYGWDQNAARDAEGRVAGGGRIYRRVPGRPSLSLIGSGLNPIATMPLIPGSFDLDGASGTLVFEWGPTTALGRTTTANIVGPGSASVELPDLRSSTSYFVRLRLNTAAGPIVGPTQSFLTRNINHDVGVVVQAPIGMPLEHNSSTVAFGSVRVGESGKQNFTIQNITSSTVTVSSVVISGTDADLFSASAVSSTPLVPRQEFALAHSGFTVTYTPDEAANHSAKVTITTSAGAFVVNLSGSGIVEPDIAVAAGGFGLSTDGDESIDFGSGTVGVGISKTFKINNTGNDVLSSLSAEILGDNASNFVIQGALPGSISAGGESSFSVLFTPSFAGEHFAILRLTSDDPDEGSVDIALSGRTPASSNLVVEFQEGGAVTHNVAVPFGTKQQFSTTTKAFVVRNTGSGPMTGISVGYTGGNSAAFPIVSAPVATLYPGESAPLVVNFYAYVPIFQQGIYTISSNASNNNAFRLVLNGTGDGSTIPDIDVVDADSSPYPDGSTLNFGTPAAGVAVLRTLTIKNIGAVNLTGVSLSFAPGSSSDFTITQLPATTVATNGSTKFTVRFKPTTNGFLTAALRIASNDPDENPYDITLTGTGLNIPVPDIKVEFNDNPITTDGPPINYGVVPAGSTPAVKTFKISNTGTGPLSGITASFENGSSGDFKLTKAVGSSLAAGASANMEVTFKPTKNGPVTATLILTSNDPDESPFKFNFTATGMGAPEPEIAVEASSQNINTGGTFTFPSIAAHLSSTQIFTIKNTGAAGLTGITVSFQNGSSPAFSLVTPPVPSATVAKGASTTFAVRFAPGAVITSNAALLITSNDADEGSFIVNLSGTGTATTAPLFTQHPQSQLKLLNSSVGFTASATGVDNHYQWKKNGANITGANGTNLQFTPKSADAAAYTLFAKNAAGENTSRPAYLGLVTLSQGSLLVKEGGSFTLKCVVVIPKAPGVSVTYSWRRSGNPLANEANHISGAQSDTLTVTNAVLGDSGNFTCLVTMTAPDGDFQCANGDTGVNVVKQPTITPFTLPDITVSETVTVPPVTADFAAKFTASGLPPGVTFNGATGEFGGKPTAAKITNGNVVPYVVKFTATNPAGTSDPVLVNWTVNALDPSFIGTFNGLVVRDSYTNLGFGGTIQLTTTSKGGVTGQVVLAGQKYPVTGVLDTSSSGDPTAVLTAKRNGNLGNLAVTITSMPKDGNNLAGFISDEFFDVVGSQLVLGTGEPGSANGPLDEAELNAPRGIAITENGGYIADTGNHLIRRVVDDEVENFAGQLGVSGAANGNGANAQFSSPEGLALDANGNLFVADAGNNAVRKITPSGDVTTINAPANIFSSPCALAFDDKGNLVVVNRGNHTLVRIAGNGAVTVLAGKTGVSGHKDGSGTAAVFNSPGGICYDAKLKAFFVSDTGNNCIRKVLPAGGVSTYAGAPGVPGTNPGTLLNARFTSPTGITSDGEGTLVVADGTLVLITPGGFVVTATDYVDEMNQSDQPMALVFDEDAVLAADAGLHGITQHEGIAPMPGAPFEAWRNTWSNANPIPLLNQGKYTAVMEGTQGGDPAYPQGYGYLTLAITKTGGATIAGKAADGSGITFGTFIRPEGELVLHQMLYKNTGSLQGVMFVDNNPDWSSVDTMNAPFDWYKVPQALSVADRTYKGGLPLHNVTLRGGKYTPESHVFAFLGLETGSTTENAALRFSEGGLASFTQNINVKTPNTVTVPANARGLNLTITPGTGVFTGSFNEGATKVSFEGVLVRLDTTAHQEGRGFTLVSQDTNPKGPVLSGKVRLTEADK